MRIKIFSDRYSLLVPLMDYLVTRIEETSTPVGISGPNKSRRCNGMSQQLLATEYDRDLGYWKLSSNQNIAFFTSVYYSDYTDVSINSLKNWLEAVFVPLRHEFGGSLNFEELLPERCGGRYGVRIEYSISLMLLTLDPSLLFIESKYPPIAYELLAEHIKFIQANPLELVDESLALEFVERAHNVYTSKKDYKFYKDALVTDEDLRQFNDLDTPLEIKRIILLKACNRLWWFVTSDDSETRFHDKFNNVSISKIVYSDPNHGYFTGYYQTSPDFYLDACKEIGIEHKTSETLASFKKKFKKLPTDQFEVFDEKRDLLDLITYLKEAPAINTNDQTRYHGAKVCTVEIRDSGDCYWVYIDNTGNFCIRYLFNIK